MIVCLVAGAALMFVGGIHSNDSFTVPGLLIFVVGVALLYFFPLLIAACRGHRNTFGVALLNVFFGWSLIGWVGALLWAVYREQK